MTKPMPHDPTPHLPTPGVPTPGLPIPWEALEQLAAGELPAARATTLREELAQRPTWAQAYATVAKIQADLDAQPMHDLPLALVRGVMDTVRREPAYRPLRALRWPQVAAGWAAAVVLCFAGWMTVAGAAPAFAEGATAAEWSSPVATPQWLSVEDDAPATWTLPSLPEAPDEQDTGQALAWTLSGLLLLGGGLFVALRGHAAAARKDVTS